LRKYYKWIPENVLSKVIYSDYIFRHEVGDNWHRLVYWKKGNEYNRPYFICHPKDYEKASNMVLKDSNYGNLQVWSESHCSIGTVYYIDPHRQIEFLEIPEDYEI
jgi:hypothetical protein